MDETLRGMLNAVIAEPEQDHLRLICADRYEELEAGVECAWCNGCGCIDATVDGVVVARVRCGECKGSCLVSNEMKVRAEKIRTQCESPDEEHEGEWANFKVFWNRGFIAEVSCTMAEWEQHGPAICDQHPVERVVITDKEPRHSPKGWTYYGIDGGGFDRMHVPFYIQPEPRPAASMYFPSAKAANDDLSARCIETARAKANQSSDQLSPVS